MNRNKIKVVLLSILLVAVSFFLSFNYSFFNDNDLFEELTTLYEKEDFEAFERAIKDPLFQQQFAHYDCIQKGKISHLIGKYYYANNLEKEAIKYFKETVFKHWNKCKNVEEKDIANTLYNIGISYHYTDEIEHGKGYLDTAFLLINKIENFPKNELALKFQGAGSYFRDIDDYTRAETYFKNGIVLSNLINLVDAYNIHIDLLTLYLKFNKIAKAEKLSNDIYEKYINSKNSLSNLDKAIFYLNKSEASLKQKKYSETKYNCEKAISILPKSESNYLSNAYEMLGVMYYDLKSYDQSMLNYEKAYQLRLEEQNIVAANEARAFALENIAELEHSKKNNDIGLSKINEAMAMTNPGIQFDKEYNPLLLNKLVSNPSNLYRQLFVKEKILYSKYKASKDQRILKTCLDIHYKMDSLVQSALTIASMDQSKIYLLDLLENHTSNAIEICKQLKSVTGDYSYIKQALHFSSSAKSKALKKIIESNERYSIQSDLVNSKRYNIIAQKLADIQAALIDKFQNKDSLQREFVNAQLDFDRLVNRNIITSKEDNFDTIYSKVKEAIDEKTIVIDIYSDKDSLHLFCITKSGLVLKTIASNELILLINDLKETIGSASKPYHEAAAKSLYQLLFSKLLDNNKSIEKLIFIEGGIFQNFPMEAIIDNNGKYLIESYDISYTYMLDMLAKNEKKSAKYPFSGFATNYTNELTKKLNSKTDMVYNISELNNANAELLKCKEIYTENYFLEEKANIENFKKYGFNSSIVYLSLHGLVDSVDGANSSIVFDDRNEQILLRSFELYQQPIDAELVILSVCNSADGKAHKSEGIVGLSRAFIGCGVNSLVSSLWPVSEESSSYILPQFLKNYHEGATKSSAMRSAKLTYLKQAPPSQRHPYYWANFILLSNMDNEKVGWTFWEMFGILSLLGLIGGLGYWWCHGKNESNTSGIFEA